MLFLDLETGIEDDGRKQVNEEELHIEDKDMRAPPSADQQRHQTSTQTQKKGGDGLVGPAVLLQEMADHETDAEECDEDGDGDYTGGKGRGEVGGKDRGEGDGHGFSRGCGGLRWGVG